MSDSTALGLLAGLGIFLIFLVIIMIAWLVFYLIGMYKLYVKAGQAGWKAIIPYYNSWVLVVDMCGLEWYWFLVYQASAIISILGRFIEPLNALSALASLVSVFGSVVMLFNMSKKIGKDTGWIVLSVFFAIFTLPVLGYSKNQTWNIAAPVSKNAFFDKDNIAAPASQPVNQTAPVQPVSPVEPVQTSVNPEQPSDNTQN